MKYMTWFESVQGLLPERSGDECLLFPCALPYPEILRIKEAGSEAEACLIWAKHLLNGFVAWSNFVVLGCPGGAHEPRVVYRSASEARSFADRLLGETLEFASPDLVLGRLRCEGKRATVEALLRQVEGFAASGYCESVQAASSIPSSAMAVTAKRVAVPEEAGCVDPLEWLPPEQAQIVEDLDQIRKEPHLWEERCVPCHRVPLSEEAAMCEKLLTTRMAVLVREDVLPRGPEGHLLSGGLFAVPKNEAEDRLIFDRRPENATMMRLDWGSLPSAACYTRMLLGDTQYLRASGDDLRNFYYTLRFPEKWVRYNSFGRRVDPEVVQRHGGDRSVPYRLCFRVLGMGDRNGCAIAQATHEAILKKGGLLEPQETLVYGKAAPSRDLWQGVYIDDLLISYRKTLKYPIPLDGSFIPPLAEADDPDMKLVKAAEDIYDKANLKRALHKAFRAECSFKAWGAEVCGIRGRVGAPKKIRQQVWYLISLIVESGWACKGVLEKVNGFLAFAFLFRRELFCLQHRIYTYVSKMPDAKWVRLPSYVVDELHSLSLHLVFAEWDMRYKLSSSILATDATPTSGGAVQAVAPHSLVQELWRRSEVKGAPIRLDRNLATEEPPEPTETSAFASAVAESLPWAETASYSFRESSHINLQEARALRRELRILASQYDRGKSIQICFNDSLVCVYAFSKGRSSSIKLNSILRGLLPYLIMGRVSLALLWVETESNIADFPSRWKPVPAPRTAPAWLRAYGVGNCACFCGLEVFSGAGVITAAHLQRGLHMRRFDEYGENLLDHQGVFNGVIDYLISQRLVQWLWLAPPSSTFSRLRDLGASGPLRPAGRPQGDESKPEVVRANQVWRRALGLATQIAQENGFFVIEHPAGSKAWLLPETQRMQRLPGVTFLKADLCAFVGECPEFPPNRRTITVMTNAPWVTSALKRCPRNHTHGCSLRGARARAPGAYPYDFAAAIADACFIWRTGGPAQGDHPDAAVPKALA